MYNVEKAGTKAWMKLNTKHQYKKLLEMGKCNWCHQYNGFIVTLTLMKTQINIGWKNSDNFKVSKWFVLCTNFLWNLQNFCMGVQYKF